MERTVPRAVSEEIELYLRTYYSLLRASGEVKIRALEEVHAGMNSLLHTQARAESVDMSALTYCLLRLPPEIERVRLVALGQSPEVFATRGFGDIESWQETVAPARRRRCFFDGSETLACLIASRSDIDDIVPMLTAFQIEWNKLHRLLRALPEDIDIAASASSGGLPTAVGLPAEDLDRLKIIWGDRFVEMLQTIRSRRCDMRVQLLAGSLSAYRRATHAWWNGIQAAAPELTQRPVYFVSSNSHSLVNILSGFALQHEEQLLDYLSVSGDRQLKQEWEDIQAQEVRSPKENFLYYLLKKYLQHPEGEGLRQMRAALEAECRIQRVASPHSFDLEAQVIELSSLQTASMDPRLRQESDDFLSHSDAFILNINYPLGLSAYDLLLEVAENVGEVLGVYILGKAATLNGVVGDVLIPNVVYDGHSYNSYLFPNAFDAAHVDPYLTYGTVLDNQKAVTVRGTFLQNATYMDVFYEEGYTDIEMEAGPFLSAVYEMSRPKRHPKDEIVNLYDLPFDLGILHYASDKPLSKGKNLGAASLSYFGMDPTYATTIPILRRIFELERRRVGDKRSEKGNT